MLKETLRKLGPEFGILTEDESAEVEQNVMNRLDRSVKLDEVDTITFGLETDDGKIVKVYVKADQAEDFEKALSDKLGEVDDIEEVLNELSKEYDIIDVEWPDDDETESDEEEDEDGSDVLDPKVHDNARERAKAEEKIKAAPANESLTVGEKFTMDILEGVNASSIESRFTTPSQLMVYHAILELGIPEIALSRSPHRAIIIKQIKDKALELIRSSQMKNALKLFINNSIDFDAKAAKNEKESRGGKEKLKDSKQIEGELLVEGVASDFWSTFTALINYIAKSPEAAAKLLDDTKVTQLRSKSTGALSSNINAQLKTKLLALKAAMVTNEEVKPDSYFVTGLQLNEGATPTEILALVTQLLSLADPSKEKIGAEAVLKSAAWQAFFNGAKPTLTQKFVGQVRSKLNTLKLVMPMSESKDPAWMADHKNKNAQLAHAYQYGSEKFDEGHMIEVIGEDGDSYIVKPFPIMANGHMKLKKTAVKLLGKINVPVGGSGGRMPGGLNEATLGARIAYDDYAQWKKDLPPKGVFNQSDGQTRVNVVGKDFEGVAGTWSDKTDTGWIYEYYLKKSNLTEFVVGTKKNIDPQKWYVWSWDDEVVLYGTGYSTEMGAKHAMEQIKKKASARGVVFSDTQFKIDQGSKLISRYLTESTVPEWSFEMNEDDLYVISCNNLKVSLNDEEIEKLIKGVTNKDTVIVRDNDDPTHKVAFSPRGSSIMVKKVGTPEGIMMKQKDVDSLLDFISDGAESTPDEEDEDKANPDVKAKKDKEAKAEKEDGKMKE